MLLIVTYRSNSMLPICVTITRTERYQSVVTYVYRHAKWRTLDVLAESANTSKTKPIGGSYYIAEFVPGAT